MIAGLYSKTLIFRVIILLALVSAPFGAQGCHWGRQEAGAKADVTEAPGAAWVPEEPREEILPVPEPIAPADEPAIGEAPSGVGGTAEMPAERAAPAEEPAPFPEAGAEPAPPEAPEAAKTNGTSPPGARTAPHARDSVNGARRPAQPEGPAEVPAWARSREELVYRIEFLGITMGYARFTYKGKARLGVRETYHLNVRAWTSNVLSLIYPINDTIDYYLDVRTLAPLRLDFTRREREKDDVAVYDQESGTIVYRLRSTGEIRKQVDAGPNVYDPVSVAYYFRAHDLGLENRPRNVYAGRKVWQISARNLGVERLSTARGQVDTVVIQPVIKRNGKLEDKGDLRLWMTNDAQHVPVRFYAKFKKIRVWTLVGELLPQQGGG